MNILAANNQNYNTEPDTDCIDTLRADKARQRFLQSQSTEPRTNNTTNGGNGIPGASSREGSSSGFCTNNTTNGGNDIPCYYQAEPRIRETYRLHPRYNTHSSSREAYDNWAWKQTSVLFRKHQEFPPDYFATIKFREPITLNQYAKFWEVLRHGLADQSRKYNHELAGWWILAVERDNTFHNHVLIRTKITESEGIIRRAIQKASSKVFRSDLAYLKWLEPVQTIEGATAYSTKLNQQLRIVVDDDGEYQKDKVLLFKQEFGLKIVRSFGHYFTVAEKAELFKETLEDWNATANTAFISEHPELLPEINSNALYAYAIQDDSNRKTLDEITTNITKNMRKGYRDIMLEGATKAQKRQARMVSRFFGTEYKACLEHAMLFDKAVQKLLNY